MKNLKSIPTLEQQYKEVFRSAPLIPQTDPDYLNLEQPYFGRIVDTVTTYSVHEIPVHQD